MLFRSLFAQIGQDKNVPQSVRVRVRQIASGLGYDGGVELPTDAPADPGREAPGADAQSAPAQNKPA